MSPASSSAEHAHALRALLTRPDLAHLLTVLNAGGEEARVVGGAVRDALMHRPVGDIDIATTALPETVIRRVTSHGWKAVPTGIEHGTVTVVINGVPFEVTTLRRDVSTGGRRAIVAFTRDFAEDAFRRDFTINALSLAVDGTVHDYSTGVADARAGLVRFMGAPETRIREDYLRILRFFRFQASHGSAALDAEGLAACAALKAGLGQLSRERIRQEILKLLVANAALAAVQSMLDIGIWQELLPDIPINLDSLRHMVALENGLGLSSHPIRRLAALLLGSNEALAKGSTQAKSLRAAITALLRLSRKQQTVLTAIERHATGFEGADVAVSLFGACLIETNPETALDCLIVGLARSKADRVLAKAWLESARPLLENPPSVPFRQLDFAALGIGEGPERGQFLKQAIENWIRDGLSDDPARHQAILAAMLPGKTWLPGRTWLSVKIG
ncbi:MAG: CCA tRNA nucleotidyltransferase [Beijerinckiaceae bacterium]